VGRRHLDLTGARDLRDASVLVGLADWHELGQLVMVHVSVVTASLNTVEVYGPIATLTPSRPMQGATVAVNGNNFAANATVKVYLGKTTGTLLATGRTTGSGVLSPPIFFASPAAADDGFVTIVDGVSTPTLGRNYQDVLTLAPGVSDVDGDGNPSIHGSRDTDVIKPGDEKKGRPIQVLAASADRREVAVTFLLPGRMDIPSDGQAHKHLIATREMDAKIEHRAVPRIVPAVFLVATVTLPGEVPLLAGKVQHFVGGDLVGTSIMPERAAGEEFTLSFGPDDRVKAERKQIQKRVERHGKDDEVAYRFVTTVENHLGRDGVIEVKDRIPVSDDERIEIALDDETTTAGAAIDPNEPGILTWKVPVPKDAKREIDLVYRVRAPRGVVVAGLE